MIAALLLVGLVLVVIASVFVMNALGLLIIPQQAEKERIRAEVRRAEWRLHRVASDAFQAMLDEARRHRQL